MNQSPSAVSLAVLCRTEPSSRAHERTTLPLPFDIPEAGRTVGARMSRHARPDAPDSSLRLHPSAFLMRLPVTLPKWPHPFPFRTRPLSTWGR